MVINTHLAQESEELKKKIWKKVKESEAQLLLHTNKVSQQIEDNAWAVIISDFTTASFSYCSLSPSRSYPLLFLMTHFIPEHSWESILGNITTPWLDWHSRKLTRFISCHFIIHSHFFLTTHSFKSYFHLTWFNYPFYHWKHSNNFPKNLFTKSLDLSLIATPIWMSQTFSLMFCSLNIRYQVSYYQHTLCLSIR